MHMIRFIRKQRGITVKELATSARVSPMSIYRYEQGKRTPTVEVAARLAAALRCTVDDLIEKPSA